MARKLSKSGIEHSLSLLSQWLTATHPGERFDLLVVGGAAMAMGYGKEATVDVDVAVPDRLPAPLVEGARIVAKAQGLGPGWLSTQVANVLKVAAQAGPLPSYVTECDHVRQFGDNLSIRVANRQTLISLKLWAATPAERKHLDDLRQIEPTPTELREAIRFVLVVDSTEVQKETLRAVIERVAPELRDEI